MTISLIQNPKKKMNDKIEQSENVNKYEFNTISDKKDFGSLGIPNYIIEYDPLNLVIKCPRYHRCKLSFFLK